MTVVEGTIVPGEGTASGKGASFTLPIQWNTLIKHFPEIQGARQSTINVCLKAAIIIYKPDCNVPPFEWTPGTFEGFSFLRVQFECPSGNQPINAWLYIAQHSPHTDKHIVEIITEKLGAASHGTECKVHFPRVTRIITQKLDVTRLII